MNRFRIQYWLIIVLLSIIWGCATAPQKQQAQTPARKHSPQSENHYYYYTAAQLQRKAGNIENAIFFLKLAIQKDPNSSFLKKELVFLYLQQNNYKDALVFIDKLLNRNPDDLEALILKANIRMYQKETDQAKDIYKKAIELNPKRKNVYLLLGSIYLDEEAYEKALEVYRKMITRFPKAYTGYFFLGKTLTSLKQYLEAEKQFRKALEIEPMLVEPRYELIDIYKNDHVKEKKPVRLTIRKGDSLKKISRRLYRSYNAEIEKAILALNPDLNDPKQIQTGETLLFPAPPEKGETIQISHRAKVVQLYREILELYPNDIRANMELGLYHYKTGDRKKAQKIFNWLADKSLTDPDVAGKIIFLYIDHKKYEDALTILKGILKKIPDNSDMNHLAGATYDGLQNIKKALYHFGKVAEDSKFFENATIYIAYIHKNENRPAKAIETLEKAISKVPDNPEFYFYLGYFFEDLQDYPKAESVLKKGLELMPDSPRLHFRLGVVYDKWGKKNASIQRMKKVIDLDPQDAHALNYLGYTYLDLGIRFDRAEQLIRKAMELEPKDGYITDSLGWLYYKKGNFQKALKTLKKAIALVPDDPIILEHLGDVHTKLDDREKALKFYHQALKKKEKDKKDLLQKIRQLSDGK